MSQNSEPEITPQSNSNSGWRLRKRRPVAQPAATARRICKPAKLSDGFQPFRFQLCVARATPSDVAAGMVMTHATKSTSRQTPDHARPSDKPAARRRRLARALNAVTIRYDLPARPLASVALTAARSALCQSPEYRSLRSGPQLDAPTLQHRRSRLAKKRHPGRRRQIRSATHHAWLFWAVSWVVCPLY